MSVIAWDGQTLAADCQGTTCEMRVKVRKIRRLPNGDLLAWAGEQAHGQLLAQWYEDGCDPKAWPAFQRTDNWSRLIIVKNGKPFTLEQEPSLIPVLGPFAAWGSGRDFAMGAMAMGADATMAIKVATRFCVSCGMGVMAFRGK